MPTRTGLVNALGSGTSRMSSRQHSIGGHRRLPRNECCANWTSASPWGGIGQATCALLSQQVVRFTAPPVAFARGEASRAQYFWHDEYDEEMRIASFPDRLVQDLVGIVSKARSTLQGCPRLLSSCRERSRSDAKRPRKQESVWAGGNRESGREGERGRESEL